MRGNRLFESLNRSLVREKAREVFPASAVRNLQRADGAVEHSQLVNAPVLESTVAEAISDGQVRLAAVVGEVLP